MHTHTPPPLVFDGLLGSLCSGLVGLMNKNLVSSLISQYAQVVLWFCRTGLLPEGSGTYNTLPSASPLHDSVACLVVLRRWWDLKSSPASPEPLLV